MKKKLLIVIGTRPELIKLAPVIIEFKKRFKAPPIIILNTAQHKELLKPYWNIFNIKPDYELNFMKRGQSLAQLSARGLLQFEKFLNDCYQSGLKISGVLAQGDTTSVMISSLIAFYHGIPFYHLEAGLRTNDLQNPFPEEFNRKVASITAQIHFAPTKLSKQNLIHEGIKKNIYVTGNTIVDAVEFFKLKFNKHTIKDIKIKKIFFAGSTNKVILITCHRRENHGKNLLEIISAVNILANKYSEFKFIWPLHPNPNVINVVKENIDKTCTNIVLTPPLEYEDLLYVMQHSKLILTDSGGIQEEAPSFNVPVIILREKTERPEGVKAKIAWLVGTKKENIIKLADYLLKKKSFKFKNPYGNGRASELIVDILLANLNIK